MRCNMNIFEFAREKEKFSEDYYRKLAKKTNNKGLKNICLMLAEEEMKHYKIVQDMQNNSTQGLAKTSVIKDAQKIFESMKTAAEKFNFDISEQELYKKARDIEQQSIDFYLEKARETDNPYHKNIFTNLAEEEKKHYLLLDKICIFVERPKWFLENAEMYRFDDYAEGVL